MPGDAGRPVYLSSLRSSRRTYLQNERGIKVMVDDHWRAAGKVDIGWMVDWKNGLHDQGAHIAWRRGPV